MVLQLRFIDHIHIHKYTYARDTHIHILYCKNYTLNVCTGNYLSTRITIKHIMHHDKIYTKFYITKNAYENLQNRNIVIF